MCFAAYPSLKGAVVFITGGASGIGAEIVRAFADQGSRIGFIDIDTDRGGALADELEGRGAEIHFESCDLRDIEALKRAFAALEATLGPATVLVNNAARDDRHNWQQVTPDYYDERIATNLRHMLFAIQAVAPGRSPRARARLSTLAPTRGGKRPAACPSIPPPRPPCTA
jgi:NAD(P)-dependent dehydrogenase (short-subunit alcohol dehydrogenase family)